MTIATGAAQTRVEHTPANDADVANDAALTANETRAAKGGVHALERSRRTGAEPDVLPQARVLRDPSDDRRNFLSSITYDYGPRDVFAPFFLHANQAVSERGLTLVASSLDDLLAVNRANADTWLPIVSIFNSESNDIDPTKSYCILGLDPEGEVVATQAVRLFEWTDTNLAEQVGDMRLFYTDPAKRKPNEHCTITAPSAKDIYGRVAYSGAAWYRPDYRKKGLTGLMPRIARAYAYTRWATDRTITLMAEGIVACNVPARVGYENVEWGARFHNNALEGPEFALLWMDDMHLINDLRAFVVARSSRAQVDAVVQQRAAE